MFMITVRLLDDIDQAQRAGARVVNSRHLAPRIRVARGVNAHDQTLMRLQHVIGAHDFGGSVIALACQLLLRGLSGMGAVPWILLHWQVAQCS
jgi:hypothetical protein